MWILQRTHHTSTILQFLSLKEHISSKKIIKHPKKTGPRDRSITPPLARHDPPQDKRDNKHSTKGQHYYRQDPRDRAPCHLRSSMIRHRIDLTTGTQRKASIATDRILETVAKCQLSPGRIHHTANRILPNVNTGRILEIEAFHHV